MLSCHNDFYSELQNCNEHSFKAFSSSFFYFLIILFYNHESSTCSLCIQETLLVESQEKGKEKNGKKHTSQKFSMAPKNIQMVTMDSPLFDYVLFYFLLKLHLVEENCVAQKKCADFFSSIKTLSSNNV